MQRVDKPLVIGHGPLSLQDVEHAAMGRTTVSLDDTHDFTARIDRSAEYLGLRLSMGDLIYGVTSGYGADWKTTVPHELTQRLPINLVNFHGCATGEFLRIEEVRAAMIITINSLSRGYSGVRKAILDQLAALINNNITPCIPCEGSVGASGDLTPLSYIAATLMGQREVWFGDTVMPADEALTEAGIIPLILHPKEGLAIMNSTAVMTGIAVLAYSRAYYIARLAAAITAIAIDALGANHSHMDSRIFDLKPHKGSAAAAAWIRTHLQFVNGRENGSARCLQDRYSLRCAPHVIGALLDGLSWIGNILETELNSVNDNPLIFPEEGAILNGGNFYGGHVALAMDMLKTATASIADLSDRQLMLLLNSNSDYGLPDNLCAPELPDGQAHHGFKAMQITASALTAEALRNTMPASSFSRSTESHNQDKVSMGTIAARDAMRIIDLTEKTLAIELLSALQAVDLRGIEKCTTASRAIHTFVRRYIPMVVEDRRMDTDIIRVLHWIRLRELPLQDIDMSL
ncbi:MAG: aromatic amino acid lyase [Nitrospirae bacterium]|nr:aromatic amino acid lyase [Nitrospirota bacterium]